MKLKDWIKANEAKASELATQLNVSRTTLWRWSNGASLPGKQDMQEITQLTDGKVTANDFYS